jgi:outer membrane usher protein
VFINNQQVSSQQVPAGPFVIDRLPAISGAGDVRLVVRDAFGREQIITAPFYSSASLLKKGLAQYSVELGKIRENFGIESNDYGTPLVSATYRRGMNDVLTLEAHGEAQQFGPRAVGLDAALRLGTIGVVTATLAQGADEDNSGFLAAASFERGGKRFSVNARSQFASDGFRQVGDSQTTLLRPKQQHILQTSANFYTFGTLAIAYAVATYPNEPRREVGTLSHNVSLPHIGYLGLSISRTWSQQNSTSAFLILTAPIGANRSASLTARYDQEASFEQREAIATFQQNPPIGNGTGYRLAVSTENNYSGAWLRQFDYAAIEVQAAKYFQTQAARATVAGAAVGIGGDVFATRSVTDSFALVDIAGIPEMDVMVDNQIVRQSDQNGRALIRNLRAYESNRISVDPRQLPLDTRIDSDRMTVAPRYRSGLVVKFPVARERSGTFKLQLPNGRWVPTGAEVVLKGNRFPVALDGLVYVTGLDHGMSGHAEWRDGQCDFRVDAPPSDDPLPDLGTIVCRTSTP